MCYKQYHKIAVYPFLHYSVHSLSIWKCNTIESTRNELIFLFHLCDRQDIKCFVLAGLISRRIWLQLNFNYWMQRTLFYLKDTRKERDSFSTCSPTYHKYTVRFSLSPLRNGIFSRRRKPFREIHYLSKTVDGVFGWQTAFGVWI